MSLPIVQLPREVDEGAQVAASGDASDLDGHANTEEVGSTSTRASSSRQCGMEMPNRCRALPESSREQAGRRAGVGYSALEMGSTRSQTCSPRAGSPARIAVAKSYQVVAPADVR